MEVLRLAVRLFSPRDFSLCSHSSTTPFAVGGGRKNDSREYSGYSVLDRRVEHPERVEVAFVPSGLPVNTLQLMVSLNLPPNYPALIAPS